MSISRRSFLRALAVGVAVVATRPGLRVLTPIATDILDEAHLSLADLFAAKRSLLTANSAPPQPITLVFHPSAIYDLGNDVAFLGIKMVPLNASALGAFDRRGAA